MARQQKNKAFVKPNKKPLSSNTKGKKAQKKQREDKLTSKDVFEAEELNDRRKGHDLDEVDNLEYDAGEIEEEDDEEIDSDEAFDESDEERFENFKFMGSTKTSEKKALKKSKKVAEGEIDLSENSEESQNSESEPEDGEDFIDLSQMLEGNNAGESNDDVEDADYSDEEFKGFDNIVEDEGDDSESDDNFIANFVEGLETKKRRRNEASAVDSKKRRQLKERSEAYKENEFNLTTRETDSADKKISLDDLMSTVNHETALGSMKQGIETLAGKGKHVTRKALDAPLAKRIQDRMERQVASANANEEVSKWQPTVQMNRTAEHLSFPLQESSPYAGDGRTSASMASKFKAETTLEKQIADALAESGMKDEELEAFEALKLNKLSVEEVAERRKELRMMRELMFRHEMRNKRLKKIKSKSYRKLKRKDKERVDSQMEEDLEHDMEDDDKIKSAMDRAEERMTLKHKNTSQWAKRALARGTQDEGTREAIMEQLRRGEELRKKIDGSDSEGDHEDDLELSQQISNLKKDIEHDTQPKKGLLSMKFMQEAAKRQDNATLNDLEAFEKEWLDPDSDNDKEKKNSEEFTVISNNPGRMAFGAKAKKVTLETDKNEDSRTNSDLDEKDIENSIEKEVAEVKVVKSKPNKKAENKKAESKKAKNQKSENKKFDDENSQDKEQNNTLDLMVHKSNITFSQRELVARAFANDDVVAEFEEEKSAQIAEDGDKVEDLTLPGWGSWGGSGTKPKKNKKKVIKVTKGIAANKRRDAKLANVIINEKANPKADKYQATGVPFPFKTKEQYERSLNTPVGSEWNTSQTLSKNTKPRVLTKLGKVIDPLSNPFI
ncbi:small-subunit processome [Sporodiniella umbellata]|nr:small-subunit processome [Sporodiniella umbellata]